MTLRDRLLKLVDKEGLNANQFYTKTGLGNGFLNTVGESLRKPSIEKLKKTFPHWNIDWLLSGEGEMLLADDIEKKVLGNIISKYGEIPVNELNDNSIIDLKIPINSESDIATYEVPLLPISAQGGSLNDFVVSFKDIDCEKIISPIKGATFAITVTGDSMAPEYPSGSQILIKKINDKAFIEWGRVYVLDTCNGVVIKRIVPSNKEGCVQCMSDNNPMVFAPFDINMNNIFGIYKVMLCMSVK